MNQPEPKRPSLLKRVLLACVAMAMFLFVGFVLLMSTATAGGYATLPSGKRLDIQCRWGFGVANNKLHETVVSISGHELVFSETTLIVDGRLVEEFDSGAEQFSLVSDAAGLRLKTDQSELQLR